MSDTVDGKISCFRCSSEYVVLEFEIYVAWGFTDLRWCRISSIHNTTVTSHKWMVFIIYIQTSQPRTVSCGQVQIQFLQEESMNKLAIPKELNLYS